MKFSYQWLTTLVDLKGLLPVDVANAFHRAGIEVESVMPLVKASHITTGLVKQRTMIEGSDHLSKVLIDTGRHGQRTIVCGASNIREGQKVLVALPGAILPKLTIQESVIKGVTSQGMVCALNELGLDAKFLTATQLEGIEILDAKTQVGDDTILETLGLTDTIIELKLLANRPDLWAMEGIAMEVAALLNRSLIVHEKPKAIQLKPSTFQLDVKTEKVKQFSIRVLEGIELIQTPTWIKQRLIASGIRPISFLVDVGNYVMLLTGQPLHMYDLKKMQSKAFTVVEAIKENFLALDGKTYALQPGDIVIKSGSKIMCLAGVMGAHECAVDATTKDIAIEAASFDPSSIRKTALRLNLISDASIRFAKGIDLSNFEVVLEWTTHLILSITSIQKVSQSVSVNRLTVPPVHVSWTSDAINGILSTKFSDIEINQSLARLGIVSTKVSQLYQAVIPRSRKDLVDVSDLAEEVIRLIGFDAIQTTPMPLHIQAGGLSEKQEKIRLIKNYLASQGLDETLTYSLVEERLIDTFQLIKPLKPWILKNPLSEERKHVRTDIVGSLLQVVQYNLARQVTEGKIFEVSQISFQGGEGLQLGIVLFGELSVRSVIQPQPQTFYHLKGIVEGILSLLQIESSRYQWVIEPNLSPILHPGRSGVLMIQNQRIGVIGQLTPTLQSSLDLGKPPVFVAQIDLFALLSLKTSPLKLKAIPRFPSVTRDLAFYVSETLAFAHIIKTVKKAGKKLVNDVLLFDLYQGNQLPKGQIAMAIRVILLDDQKTLQEEEINQTMIAIKSSLVSECQITLRS
jgi:phenylalanyl-tRNA synthetase beta chain